VEKLKGGGKSLETGYFNNLLKNFDIFINFDKVQNFHDDTGMAGFILTYFWRMKNYAIKRN
jgi:hypothetical protein